MAWRLSLKRGLEGVSSKTCGIGGGYCFSGGLC